MDEPDEVTTARPDALRRFCGEVLMRLKVPVEDAELVADQLIEADLRGIHSHGIMRLPVYAGYLEEGYYNPTPRVRVVNESSVHALFDGDRGMGFIPSTLAMRWCIERAESTGFGMAGVRNSHHNGAAAHYAIMAAKEDLIGFASTNVIPLMAPPGSSLPTHGNNPVCFAMPRGQQPMLVVDMATSVKAWGNILNYRRENREIPLGWALDKEGAPTSDPHSATTLVPIGEGGFKGFGLAVVMDVLCGVLTGSNFARRFELTRLDDNVGHFFFAIDPELFMPIVEFKSRLDETLSEIRDAPRNAGVERIFVPGELEADSQERMRREGIPISRLLKAQLAELGDRLGVSFGEQQLGRL